MIITKRGERSLIFVLAFLGGSANAQSCSVTPIAPQATLVTPYAGDCKDGMASGRGNYAFTSQNSSDPIKVSGVFAQGLLEGEGQIDYPAGIRFEGLFKKNKRQGFGKSINTNGTWSVGTWNDGKTWNVIGVSLDKAGERHSYQFVNGDQYGLCHATGNNDPKRCPPQLRSVVTLSEPPQSLIAEAKADTTGASVQSKSSSGIQVIGNIPAGLTAEWVADACGSSNGSVAADRTTAKKVELFEPMKAADVDFGKAPMAAVPKSSMVYPAEITYKMEISGSYDKIKQYMTGTRRGFIYKSPFGKYECSASKNM